MKKSRLGGKNTIKWISEGHKEKKVLLINVINEYDGSDWDI